MSGLTDSSYLVKRSHSVKYYYRYLDRSAIKTSPLYIETGPLYIETGPLFVETGPLYIEIGPLCIETGPL